MKKKTFADTIKLPAAMLVVVTVVKDAADSLPLLSGEFMAALADRLNPQAVPTFVVYRCSIWPDRMGTGKWPQGFRPVADCSHHYTEAREMFAYLVSRSLALQNRGSDFRHDFALVMRVSAAGSSAVHTIDCATGRPMEWQRNGETATARCRRTLDMVNDLRAAVGGRRAPSHSKS